MVIQGVRRCGKSTLLSQMPERIGLDPARCLFVNFEDPRLANQLDHRTLDRLVAAFESTVGAGEAAYFFDEIQHVDGWQAWLRTELDTSSTRRFVLTGSNAHLLSGEIGSALTGRHLRLELFPFSFGEYRLEKAERDHGALPARRRPPRATPDRRGRPTPPRLLQRHRRTRCPRAGGSEVVATAATARTAVRVSRFGDQHPSLRGNDRHVGRYDVPVSGGPGGRLPRVRVPVFRLLRAQARRARQEVLPRRPRHASRLRVLGKRRPWQGARVRRVRPAPADVRRCVLLAWSRRGRLRGPAERPAYSDPSDLGQTEGAAPQVTRSVLRRSPARERGCDLHRAGPPQRVGPASRPGSSGAAGAVVTRRTSPPPGVSPASASPSSRDPLRRARTPPSGAGSMPAVGREARAGTT